MISVTANLHIDENEVELSAIRSQGSGGQNVNKVATAIHLRFDIAASSLPEQVKERLLKRRDSRVTTEGVFVMKSQNYRTQEQNRADALLRLTEWIQGATVTQKRRKPTRPGKGVKKRRMETKQKQSRQKQLRKKVDV